MIRHSVFALVLVGAAFAGGAAINGPGLTWLQRTVLGGPTIIVDGSSAPPPSASTNPPKPFPTAKTSPLFVDLPRGSQSSKKASEPVDEPVPVDNPLLPPETPSNPASALVQAPTPDPDPAPAPTLVKPVSAPASPRGRTQRPAELELGTLPKNDPVARLASAEPPPSTNSTAPDWAEIRKRMKALGIARYTIEAETSGRVRISCVIPLEGLRAVGHQFEAEGDDEYQAAEAALRRIALWQATEAK